MFFFRFQHGSNELINTVLSNQSDAGFRYGYYSSPADPDRQPYTQVLEGFLRTGFRIEDSAGAGTEGFLRNRMISQNISYLLSACVCVFFFSNNTVISFLIRSFGINERMRRNCCFRSVVYHVDESTI